MAAMTFSLGGIQVWMPQFLFSERHYSLVRANFLLASSSWWTGLWRAGRRWFRRYCCTNEGSYYLVSAASMALGVPVMIVALFVKGRAMVPAIALAAFFLLLNTSPLNAAVMNSVGAHIPRHGDCGEYFLSFTFWRRAFADDDGLGGGPALLASGVCIAGDCDGDSAAILFTGCDSRRSAASESTLNRLDRREHLPKQNALAHLALGGMELDCGGVLALAWLRGLWKRQSECRASGYFTIRVGSQGSGEGGEPGVAIIVPARNEEEHIRETLTGCSSLTIRITRYCRQRPLDGPHRADHGRGCRLE